MIVCPFVSRVPHETDRVADHILQVSCIVHPHPTPEKVRELASVTPAKVVVFPVDTESNVRAPVYVRIRPEYSVMLPDTVIATDPDHVTSHTKGAAKLRSRQSFVVASIVTV